MLLSCQSRGLRQQEPERGEGDKPKAGTGGINLGGWGGINFEVRGGGGASGMKIGFGTSAAASSARAPAAPAAASGVAYTAVYATNPSGTVATAWVQIPDVFV